MKYKEEGSTLNYSENIISNTFRYDIKKYQKVYKNF